MNEHSEVPSDEERVEDLDVPASESDEVKGGASDYLLEIEGIKGESTGRRVSKIDAISIKQK